MLHALLKDRVSGQSILAATTHLKAKRGQVLLRIILGLRAPLRALEFMLSGNLHSHACKAILRFYTVPEQANEAARELQAVQMMERLAAAEAASSAAQRNGNGASVHRPVVILCGDFNDVPTSAACRVCAGFWLALCRERMCQP